MRLEQVLKGLKYEIKGELEQISGVSYDSRSIKDGDLFVAIPGLKVDGHDYLAQAEERGAVAAVVEYWVPNLGLTQILVPNARKALGLIGANFYKNPSEKLKILGITGTNGKTTSTYMVKSILEAAGYKVGLIGTIEVLIGDSSFVAQRTTPESLDLQRILAKMVAEKVDFVVMEVSSHALDLFRTSGIKFAGALFTNLSQDHLDYHKSIREYFAAKTKLFQDLGGPAIINIDDKWGIELNNLCPTSVVSYGITEVADFKAENIKLEKLGVSYILNSEVGQIPITLNITGYFNVYNSLGVAALCFSQGVSLTHIQQGLASLLGVPGRFQQVKNDRGLHVIVDYAHTPDGLENILSTAKELMADGRLIVVFGAGGDRDQSKRPLMGEVASRLSDIVIITSDNPRSEEPASICAQIEQGLLSNHAKIQYKVIVDRREAIRHAVQIANSDDLVIIAGKGHETYQETAGNRLHFDDVEEVKLAIKELRN